MVARPAAERLSARIAARLAAVPLPRWRRILISLYLLAAIGDTAGKALASDPRVNRAVARALPARAAVEVTEARRPRGNFEIFRAAPGHLFAGEDLYAWYPDELQDQFKYSPAFAMLFTPFAWLPWTLALFLWGALNAFALFIAIERLLPQRAALVALAFLLPEVLRAMQNAQSNALVAALIIFAFVALERAHVWRAATAIVVGAAIKLFPLAALTFALPRRVAIRTGLAAAAASVVMLALPLLVTPASTLANQYRSWRAIEASDALLRLFSAMELVHRWVGGNWANWPIQVVGTGILLAPLALRRERWTEHRFRLRYLCSLLLYVVLFNHMAERASFVIAFTGMAIWFASEPRTAWRTAMFGVAFVTIPLMATVLPVPSFLKSETGTLYRVALPTLLIWGAMQWALLRRRESETSDDVDDDRLARAGVRERPLIAPSPTAVS